MQLDRRSSQLNVAAFNGRQLENVVDEIVHARRVFTNDGKKALAALRIFPRTAFECLDKRHDRRQRRAQFVRNVREKFLTHELETFGASDVEENSERAFGAITVYLADRHDAQIEHLPVWSM